jgi:hypothetical protein
MIRVTQAALRFVSSREAWRRRDRVLFFNPEHLFVFSQWFLARQLKGLGFDNVVARPAELLVSDTASRIPHAVWFRLASLLWTLTGRHCVLTPSMVITGTRAAPRVRGGALTGKIPPAARR